MPGYFPTFPLAQRCAASWRGGGAVGESRHERLAQCTASSLEEGSCQALPQNNPSGIRERPSPRLDQVVFRSRFLIHGVATCFCFVPRLPVLPLRGIRKQTFCQTALFQERDLRRCDPRDCQSHCDAQHFI